jgi:hypothetical protein
MASVTVILPAERQHATSTLMLAIRQRPRCPLVSGASSRLCRSLSGIAAVRRIAITLGLALCLLGCGVTLGPVELLTGGPAGCYAGPPNTVEGPLLPDPKNGTAIKVEDTHWEESGPAWVGNDEGIVPVMWPTGYTGRRLLLGEVEVLDDAGKVVATTGKRYLLGERPAIGFATNGAFPACSNVGPK